MRALMFLVMSLLIISSCKTPSVNLVTINRVEPFNNEPLTIKNNKDSIIDKYYKTEFIPEPQSLSLINTYETCSFIDEKEYLAFELFNPSSQNEEIILSTESQLVTKLYQYVSMSDWYTERNNNLDYLQFYPDLLMPTSRDGDNYMIPVKSKERIRVLLEFSSHEALSENLEITWSINNREIKQTQIPINVYNARIPDSDFSSIIFNQKNIQSSGIMTSLWQDTALSHLQVNYIPTVYFNKDGQALSDIDHKTSSSTGYRNTVYPWIKKGEKILLFWESRHSKLAPLKDGGYIKPYTRPWYRAYTNLIDIIYQDLSEKYPNTSKDQILIYLADEVNRFKEVNGNKAYLNYIELANVLQRELPEYKTLLTYGYYSEKQIVDQFDGIDIHVPHILMPEERKYKNQNVFPYSVYKSSKMGLGQKWMYSVESGKKSPINKFLHNPFISASQGYKGYSWYSFADHTGSTWDAKDGSRLDYSLFYYKENNKLHQYWTNRLNNNDYLFSSLRLKAIEKGLVNARIVTWLTNHLNEFDDYQKQEVNKLLAPLKKQGLTKKTTTQVSFKENETHIQKIRELYSRLNKVNKK